MKNKTFFSLLIVLGIIVLVSGGTYAFYTWSSDNIKYSGSSECFKVFYVKGDDIGSNENKATLTPSYDYKGGLSSTVKFNFSSECNMEATGKLYIDTLDTTSSNLFKEGLLNYQVLEDGVVTDLKGSIMSNDTIEIELNNIKNVSNYTVYVWLDYNKIENEHATSSYFGKVRAVASQIGE
jgi:hypothetical protein